MKRSIAILALSVFGLSTGALAQTARYAWSISASHIDPHENLDTTMGPHTVYLWLTCSDLPAELPDGIAAALFAIVTDPPGVNLHIATTPVNGWLNAGTTTNLLLAVGGCPNGPVVAANLLVVVNAPGEMRLAPGPKGKGGMDCSPNPQLWPIEWVGLGLGGAPAPGKDDGTACPCGHGGFDGLFCFEGNCYDLCVGCSYEEDCAPYAVSSCDECGPTSVESMSWGRMKGLYR